MTIHFLPIEPLWQRYSEQWYHWFREEFINRKLSLHTYMGEPVGDIGTGQFLDVFGTNIFKSTQLAAFCRAAQRGEVKDGDVVFLMDVWFPGLEALAYIRQGAGINFKIMGILHDGTYDSFDFLAQKGMATWGRPLENAWFEILDKIFVATQFHKDEVLRARECSLEKLIVTGLPMRPFQVDHSRLLKTNRTYEAVFPHRLAPEKCPEKFDALVEYDGIKGIRRKEGEKPWSKTEYYRILASSEVAVSFAWQEMFGIAMLEACANGCLPLVPDRLAYSEIYPEVFKYAAHEEGNLGPRIRELIAHRRELEPIARDIPLRFEGAIGKMIDEMLA